MPSPSSLPKAIAAVTGMMIRMAPEIRNAFFMTKRTYSVVLRLPTMLGRLWWNIRANTLLEKISTKLLKLKKLLLDGVSFLTPSRQNKKMAPPRNSEIVRTLAPMMIAWSTLVLSMLLKEKRAPATKKIVSQKKNCLNSQGASAS